MKNQLKKCSKCLEIKPFKDFRPLTIHGGRFNRCLSCEQKELDYNNYLKLNNLKCCTKCNKEKTLDNFKDCGDKRARLKYLDGKYSYCIECSFIYFKSYRTGENEEKYKQKRAKIREDNRETTREYAKNRAQSRKFKTLAIVHNGRAKREFNDNNIVTPWQLFHLAHKQELKCAISGQKLTNENISLDHKIAMSQGGKNSIDNLQLVTFDVNIMKRAYNQDKFLKLIDLISFYQASKRLKGHWKQT